MVGNPADVREGLRFLGYREDVTVQRVNTGAADPEPMYQAISHGRRLAYFRAGAAQCFDGKLGDAVPCEMIRVESPVPYSLGVVPPLGGGVPPVWDLPWSPPSLTTDRPPSDGPDGPLTPPPVVVNPPQPAPVPLPPSAALLGLVLFGWIIRGLIKFSGEYETLQKQCCMDPDKIISEGA